MLLSAEPTLPSWPWRYKKQISSPSCLFVSQQEKQSVNFVPKYWQGFSFTFSPRWHLWGGGVQAQVSSKQHSLIQYSERNTEACESQQDTRSAGSIRPKLSAGMQERDALTLIKAAICRLFPRQAESHGTAGATSYQLFWKWNLSLVKYESGFVCSDSESQSLAGVRLVALDAKDKHLSCYF